MVEGFEHPIVEGSVVGDRVRATVDLGALRADWCAVQTPAAACAAARPTAARPRMVGTITIDFHVTGTDGDGTVLMPDRRNIPLMER